DRNVVVPEFFRYLIPSKRFVYNLGIISPGGAGRNRVLDRKDFSHLQFIMPPVEEQKVIAEIISTWDCAIGTLGNLVDAKSRLEKGLMQKLLNGKMRFKEFKSDRRATHVLGDCCKIISGGTPSTKKQSYWNGTIPWITSADISGIHSITPKKYITKEGVKESATNLIPQNSIIIVTRVGLGKVAVNKYAMCISQDSQGIIPDNSIFNVNYLAYYLSLIAQRFIINNQGTAIKGILKSDLESLKIICGSINEQEKIAAILCLLNQCTELLITQQNALKMQKKGLMQKLITGKIRVKI
ncbi:MAG: restriction endonuclease subunit S, partial [Candidatus Saganbacteria bacterium]|nr:restriction endonuclease subunit S [Candidatus Saganbacteria bacterium]